MPQPRSVAASAAAHADDWRRADDRIRQAIGRVLRGARGGSRAVRRAVTDATATVEQRAVAWAGTDLRRIHRLGFGLAAEAVGVDVFSDAAEAEVRAVIAAHLDETHDATRALRRGAAGFVAPDGLPVLTPAEIRALTPAELSDLLGHPIGLVRYADGSYRTVADHGDMLTRTRAATTFNRGTLLAAREAGSGLVVVRDGTGCGVSAHNDGTVADGQVWEVEFAEAHLLAHPRCQRSFHPVPEGTSRRAAARVAATAAGLPVDAPLPPLGPRVSPRARKPRAPRDRSRRARTPRRARRAT